MDFSDKGIISGIARRDVRAVSRLISLSENGVPRSRKILSKLYRHSGHAQVIGVTGSPGAGKSTLVDQLALFYRKEGKRVAIVAVDPTSPFSGGAILGDRIRMVHTAPDPNIYIRSMATRGALGGIARATLEAVHILDAAAFDVIIVETVGVGQAEVDIIRIADTCLVVLVPGMGDGVQAIKAGILEIADVFVINKADREGANLLEKDLLMLLGLSDFSRDQWRPKIVQTTATTGDGVKELAGHVLQHEEWLRSSEEGKKKKLAVIRDTIIKLLSEQAVHRVLDKNPRKLNSLAEKCFEKKTDPYTASLNLLKTL